MTHVFDAGNAVLDDLGDLRLEFGGRRAGLVDLTAQTRARILREVAEQRAEGAGVDQIVRAIRDGVPAGPWASSQTRAEVIAELRPSNA